MGLCRLVSPCSVCRSVNTTRCVNWFKTRMHSSRMRTTRSLTVCRSRSICPGRRGSACHACPPPRTPPPHATHPLPCSPRHARPRWTEWQTGVKILPCPKLRLRAVITFQICFEITKCVLFSPRIPVRPGTQWIGARSGHGSVRCYWYYRYLSLHSDPEMHGSGTHRSSGILSRNLVPCSLPRFRLGAR